MVMDPEDRTFLKRAGLCIAPVVLAAGIGIASGDSDGPLYIGIRPSKFKQEHSVNVGPLYVQWGRIQHDEHDLTYRESK